MRKEKSWKRCLCELWRSCRHEEREALAKDEALGLEVIPDSVSKPLARNFGPYKSFLSVLVERYH